LVNENTPSVDDPASNQPADAPQIGADQTATDQLQTNSVDQQASLENPAEPDAQPAEVINTAEGQTDESGSTSVTSSEPQAKLEIQPGDETQEAIESETDKPEKKRIRNPRKRRSIAISAGERVTVGRRLYRTGDSDYLMNGRLCLLRDVQDLFA